MDAKQNQPLEMNIRAHWELDSRNVPSLANQVVVQTGLNDAKGRATGVYLRLGHISPPLMDVNGPGDAIDLPVVLVGSYFLTPEAAEGLYASLGQALENVRSERTETEKS